MTGEDDHFVATAQYDYKGDSDDELSISAGQEIKVAPKGRLIKHTINILTKFLD